MVQIENYASNLIKALENKDFPEYTKSRVALVAAISDNDFMADSIQDYLLVGKALLIVLDDLSAVGLPYKRVVLTALYSLLKVIVADKFKVDQSIATASAYLFILFAENKDFIGAEYITQKVKGNAAVAAHQLIGMMCVFLWKYNSCAIKLDERTTLRLKNSISESITDSPDEATKQKVIDFEYNNFLTMIHALPYDILLKFPGIPFFDPEMVIPKIQSMFKSSSLYFSKPPRVNSGSTYGNASAHTVNSSKQPSQLSQRSFDSTTNHSNNGGCLSSVIIVIIVITTIALF